MDIYSFNINNSPYEVKIGEIKGSLAIVEVNGIEYHVDIPNIEDLEIPIISRPPKAPKRSEVALTSAPVSESGMPTPSVGTSRSTINAPMPGAVFKILVSEGGKVKAGDVVVVIEAMKMENQIRSTIEGIVSTVHVKEGENVQEGALLVTLGGK